MSFWNEYGAARDRLGEQPPAGNSHAVVQRRDWVFTVYPSEQQLRDVFSSIGPTNWPALAAGYLDLLEPRVQYAALKFEACPSTGRVHGHGLCVFKRSVRRSSCVAIIACWWAPMRGTRPQAYDYLSKLETSLSDTFAVGDRGVIDLGQGTRSDLLELVDLAKSIGVHDALEERLHLLVKYPRGLEALQRYLLRANWKSRTMFDSGMRCEVHWGTAGAGKTRAVYARGEELGLQVYKLASYDPLWFDGYDGEQILLMDDFYGTMKLTTFLSLTDKYKSQRPNKGGFTWPIFQEIHITSNAPWQQWYEAAHDKYPETKRAVRRRFDKVTHYALPFEIDDLFINDIQP